MFVTSDPGSVLKRMLLLIVTELKGRLSSCILRDSYAHYTYILHTLVISFA